MERDDVVFERPYLHWISKVQRLVPWGTPTFDPATEMMRKLEEPERPEHDGHARCSTACASSTCRRGGRVHRPDVRRLRRRRGARRTADRLAGASGRRPTCAPSVRGRRRGDDGERALRVHGRGEAFGDDRPDRTLRGQQLFRQARRRERRAGHRRRRRRDGGARPRLRRSCTRAHPGLVYTSVTPFGLTGPRRHWRGSDLVGWASSGALPSIGDADRAPLAPGGGLAYMTGALNAAMGTMVALMTQRASGRRAARRRLAAGGGRSA